VGKGSSRRRSFISRELEEIQYDLALGNISREEYDKRKEELRILGKLGRKR
jgi:uncharacterized membrane protein